MRSNKKLEESANYLRLALPLMSEHEVPVTPENYTTWYEYVSGVNDLLRDVIDTMVGVGDSFSEEANAMLYQRFFSERDENAFNNLRESLRQIFVELFSDVAGLSENTERYEAVLSSSVEKLSTETSAANIKKVVEEIVVETKEMGKTGKAAHNRLKEATEELDALKKEFEQVKSESLVDFLTGVANRKALDGILAESILKASKEEPLSFLLIDIDHFKKFNDEHGHAVGDIVLKFVAKSIRNMVKGKDFVARFGGEEFAVILPATPLAGSLTVAENIRAYFAEKKLKRADSSASLGKVTVSLGVAQYKPKETVDNLFVRTDRALYYAKENGRNRVGSEKDL